jgi:hypothetical protein
MVNPISQTTDYENVLRIPSSDLGPLLRYRTKHRIKALLRVMLVT